ncbi:MAG: tetratricopeptide repeat protein [Campylobacter sp.]|nr:tetratricopeptide repeat protein [Campylobacter sp.]
MRFTLKFIVATCLVATFSFCEEISVFGMGDVSSGSTYGLTENEQFLIQNQKKLKDLQSTVDSQQTTIDGLVGIIESLNEKVANLEARVADLEIRTTGRVSKKTASKISQPKKSVASASTKKDYSSVSLDEVQQEAKKLYSEKKYSDAKAAYDFLLSKNYQPAYTNFALGEIAFNQKNYSAAITSYQKSVSLNADAPYMPKLLLNTGKSLENLGNKESANKFFSALKSKYPTSNEAMSLQ